MSEVEANILNLIRAGENSAIMINELLLKSGFEFLACNKEYRIDEGQIGEIDGIWAFQDTILLIEATMQGSNITDKIERFFGVWSDERNLNLIRAEFERQNDRIIRVFFDLAHTSEIDLPSRQHISRRQGNFLLNKTDFTHFSEQEVKIGDLVKYDVLNLLDIQETGQRLEVPAIKVILKDTPALIFSLPVKRLLEICYISRRRDEKGYQRILDDSKISKIRTIIRNGNSITFPNSIIVTPSDVPIRIIEDEEDVYQIVKQVVLPASFCSLRVIDGQHRLLGFSKLQSNEIRNHHLVVVALLDIDSEKEVTTFIQINSTQKRMDANLLLNLKADFDYSQDHPFYFDKKAVEIARELDEDSPLKNRIYFGGIVDTSVRVRQTVKLRTLVSALKMNKFVSNRPLFNEIESSTDDVYILIRNFLNLLVHSNQLCKNLITDNRGIRLFFTLLQIIQRNIIKGNFQYDIESFILHLKSVMNQSMYVEIMQNYGEGGVINSTLYVITYLKQIYNDEYENVITTLREI